MQRTLRPSILLVALQRREYSAGEEFPRNGRKFGPEVARRIDAEPLYPLDSNEIAELTKGGPRARDEVTRILVELLRARGLAYIANRVESHIRPLYGRDTYERAVRTQDFNLLATSVAEDVTLYIPAGPDAIVGRDKLLAFFGRCSPYCRSWITSRNLTMRGRAP